MSAKLHLSDDMKTIMHNRFMPSHYYCDLFNKLQLLRQGYRNIEEYFQDMDIIMIRARVDQDREATIANLLTGLNRDIVEQVELNHYVDIEVIVDKATTIEK